MITNASMLKGINKGLLTSGPIMQSLGYYFLIEDGKCTGFEKEKSNTYDVVKKVT